ncbi:L-aspartate oxidase [Fibrobacter sp.]|uniref:L-aspartate oxidase n=1 Tax=Fibrobacter sp. TaxID=35828 RepID=UPI003864AC35
MYDILVLGAGISGLSAAIHAAEKGLSVVILTKGAKPDGSSNYAQGGIATVTEKTDKFKFHIDDTLEAGAGLCKKEPVNILTKSGPATIQQLVKWGVQFTPSPADKTQFDLHLEGGHSHHRILHAADLTGKEIMRALLCELHKHKNIHYIENCYIKDLICKGEGKSKRCVGAKIIHQKTGLVENLYAKASILSTGGAGRIWQYTVCPHDSCGDGMAIAARAGAALQDIEFMQFHPTSLYAPSLKKPFLISEAVRGFGGILKNDKGEEFMNQVHPLHSLAPRDIVARAIHSEMQRLGKPNMFIDLSGRTPKDIKSHFPNIYAKCLEAGIDITKQWIPVVPAAHYMCGGVLVDTWSRTEIKGLYACGEVAATGVHGANRLASNSLLESVVYAIRAVDNICESGLTKEKITVSKSSKTEKVSFAKAAYWRKRKKILQDMMWTHCGIVRTVAGLNQGLKVIEDLEKDIDAAIKNKETENLHYLEFLNALQVSKMILIAALHRKESRGLHYILDYPNLDPKTKHHTIYLDGMNK